MFGLIKGSSVNSHLTIAVICNSSKEQKHMSHLGELLPGVWLKSSRFILMDQLSVWCLVVFFSGAVGLSVQLKTATINMFSRLGGCVQQCLPSWQPFLRSPHPEQGILRDASANNSEDLSKAYLSYLFCTSLLLEEHYHLLQSPVQLSVYVRKPLRSPSSSQTYCLPSSDESSATSLEQASRSSSSR